MTKEEQMLRKLAKKEVNKELRPIYYATLWAIILLVAILGQ